ncbi:MAG TPA: adenylate/guanylate cyclase domain-containing protein [Gaiellaceae bacterium]|nr:adenylate/guanylate cyclase domain-containing protein [Gaiellaceae bacterium]
MDKRRKWLRMRLFLAVAGGAIGLVLAGYVVNFFFFDTLQQDWVDANYGLVRDRGTPKDVVVVGVDAQTFDDLQLRWPFPRSVFGAVLKRIAAGHPKAIAYDVQFTEPTTEAEDNALVNDVAASGGRIVLSTTETDGHGHTNIFGGADLSQFGATAGNGNVPPDGNGGVVRHMQYEIGGLKTLPVVAAGIARGKPITKSDMGGSKQWIDFPGPGGTVTTYSFSRVLPVQVVHVGKGPKPWKVKLFRAVGYLDEFATKAGAQAFLSHYAIPASAFAGKLVVIGATAPSLQDIHATATDPAMSGPEIQADMADTALRGFPLRSIASVWNIVLIVLLGSIVPFVSLRTRPLIAVATGLFFGALFTGGAILAFAEGRIVSFVYPISALILSTVAALAVHYVVTAFEKERVRDVFSRFVPETVVDQVLAQSGADLRLGGREVVGTVMFSDLRGFTSSAEFMPADSVILVLNHYLHEMSEAILRHGGTLLCYMGDGIYALFGAPIDQDDHADRALAAAREMLTERLPAFNDFMAQQDLGQGYFMGVGLNSGPVMTGNVGHERRMDYTAVGDVVNTASRIEGMTKGTPFSVLIAESTISALRSPPEDIVFYEEQAVRGRQEKLKLYALDIRKPETEPGQPGVKAVDPLQAPPAPAPATGA